MTIRLKAIPALLGAALLLAPTVAAAQSEQLINAGLQVREQWLEDADVETDPRYGPDKDGFPGGGDGSVSKPTSDFAKGATAEQVDPAWLSGLPAGQKCGG